MEKDVLEWFGAYKTFVGIKDVPKQQEIILVFGEGNGKETEDGECTER